MKQSFLVYPHIWGGTITVGDILLKYVAATATEVIPTDPKASTMLKVDITAEELFEMAYSREFDMMVSANGYLMFDEKGRSFRQR